MCEPAAAVLIYPIQKLQALVVWQWQKLQALVPWTACSGMAGFVCHASECCLSGWSTESAPRDTWTQDGQPTHASLLRCNVCSLSHHHFSSVAAILKNCRSTELNWTTELATAEQNIKTAPGLQTGRWQNSAYSLCYTIVTTKLKCIVLTLSLVDLGQN